MSHICAMRYMLRSCKRLTSGDFKMRHAICTMLLCTGCYYWPEPVEQTLNTPPRIVSSDPPEGEPFTISTATAVAFVVVEDDENMRELEYVWTVSSLGEQGTKTDMQGNQIGSYLYLDADMLYDGRTLRVRITDPSNAGAERAWPIEVLEGVQ